MATYKFTVLSEIILPISPTTPASKMIEILKHMLYKLLYLNLILTTKKKLQPSHKESRWRTGGGGDDIREGGACSGNIAGQESTWLAAGMGDICAITGGQRKVMSLASASRLTGNKNNSKSRVFREYARLRFLLLRLWVAGDTGTKSPLLGICRQTIS